MALRIPQISWGATYADFVRIGYPLDNATCYPEPGEGSEWIDVPGSVHDAWVTGTDQVLEGDVRWIPTNDITSPVTATGWDGATGWREFLEWARGGNDFRWFPDKSVGSYVHCYLVEPRRGGATLEEDGTRRLRIKIRTADGSAFTGY